MKKRYGLWGILLLLNTSVFAGCGVTGIISVDVDTRTVKEEVSIYYAEEEVVAWEKALGEGMDFTKLPKVTLNEKNYYVETEKSTIKSESLLENAIVLDDNKFILYSDNENVAESSSGEMYGMKVEFVEVTYQFDREVISSNGTIGEDGKTVVFQEQNMSDSRFYAIFSKNTANAKKITFSGAKNKKIYKEPKTIQVKSKGVIDDILVNGESASGKVYYEKTGNGGNLHYDYVELSKDGKYKITAILTSGAKKHMTVTIDQKKPKTNVKNNKSYNNEVKITFSDKTSGMKKAVLNGKRIKSGTVATEAGDYTLLLTDKAGNSRKVRFKVK